MTLDDLPILLDHLDDSRANAGLGAGGQKERIAEFHTQLVLDPTI